MWLSCVGVWLCESESASSAVAMAIAYSQSQGPVCTVKYSASHLPGNLAVLPGLENKTSLTFAVVHRGYVSLAHLASGVCTHEQAVYDERDTTSFLTQVWYYKLSS